jgi:hypothetical protein
MRPWNEIVDGCAKAGATLKRSAAFDIRSLREEA